MHGAVPPQGQDWTFPFMQLREIPVSLVLQRVKVPLNGGTVIWSSNLSSQLYSICKLAEDALCPTVQVIKEDK